MSQDASDEQARIYLDRADAYDALVSAEDTDGELVRTIVHLTDLRDAVIADVGAGTGRLSRLLVPHARELLLVDRAAPMLEVAKRRLASVAIPYSIHEADARELPIEDGKADLAIAGWVFGHFRHWMPDGWRDEVTRAVGEMKRIVRPGGWIVLIETLGTGHTEPRQHTALDEYFAMLTDDLGFTKRWIRTDYAFASVDEAATICGGFFGPSLEQKIREEGWTRVPECTAILTLSR